MATAKSNKTTLAAARDEAARRNGIFRAPHHTVSREGLLSELAISAGGVLWIEDAQSYRGADMPMLCNNWAHMHPAVRPTVYLAVETADAIDVFMERVKGAKALGARLHKAEYEAVEATMGA